MNNDRQVHFSGILSNTKAYSTREPVSRKPASWLWLKLLVVVTLVIPAAVRIATVVAKSYF